jgi:hypothetical protein
MLGFLQNYERYDDIEYIYKLAALTAERSDLSSVVELL